MADSRDITGKNRKFTGTDSIQLPEPPALIVAAVKFIASLEAYP